MQEILNIAKKFHSLNVLVVGDLMLDEYIFGEVNRISPEAPIPILDVKEIIHVPGGAANAAHNVKSLANKVIVVGVMGPEEKGKLLKEILEKKGINVNGVIVDENRKTTLKTRIVARNQHVIRTDYEDASPISQELEGKLLDFIQGEIKGINAIIISDYGKGVVSPSLSEKIIQMAEMNQILCLVDSKKKDYFQYKNCHIIIPNEKELSRALKLQIKNDDQFLQAGKTLLSQLSCDYVLVKRGEKGMALFQKEGDVFHYPAINKKAIDVSGAGDTAIAVFALALSAGADPKQAVVLASHACGAAVGKVGTAVVLLEEIEESLKNNFIREE